MTRDARSDDESLALDRYLDGELGRDALPQELRNEEERLAAWMGSLEEDVRAPSELREAVMRRVAAMPRPAWERFVDWALRPRMVRVTPAWSAAAVAACALLVAVWQGPGASDAGSLSGTGIPAVPTASGSAGAGGPITTASVGAGAVATRFVFVAPNVGSVQVTGDFLEWDPDGVPLEDLRGTGIWTVDLALPPGIYQYAFIIDGARWQPDPLAMSQVSDGFGQLNSVLIVSPRAEA